MMLLLCISGVTVFASGSDDNSLSDLGIENATSISPDFEYSTTEDVQMRQNRSRQRTRRMHRRRQERESKEAQTETETETEPFLMRQMPCSRK